MRGIKLNYKKAGVDIDGGDKFVRGIKGFLSSGKLDRVSAFGSLFDLKPILKKCKSPIVVASADGVGTKLKIAQVLSTHNSVGIDLVAMNVNDIVCLGARPLFFLDYIACGKLESNVLGDVVKGIYRGLKEADCLLLGGETAEMPGMYKRGEYDLAGFCVGIVDKNRIIDGRNIKKGDSIIGIESSGLHSNGFSLVRKAFSQQEFKKYERHLLKPTRIYVQPILSLLTHLKGKSLGLRGIAHITGGAFYNKATKILPKGLGMIIYKKSWKVPNIFKIIQKKGNISDKEMYSVFNMGIGMILVVKKEYKETIAKHINGFYKAFIIGEIVECRERLTLR